MKKILSSFLFIALFNFILASNAFSASTIKMGFWNSNAPLFSLKELQKFNLIAYAFAQVNTQGQLTIQNKKQFILFSKIQNQKIISLGGGGDQVSLTNALNNPEPFTAAVTHLTHEYHLNGIDLDFEPATVFKREDTAKYIALITALRHALGANAIITFEISADRETQASISHEQWKIISTQVTAIADMCYDFHSPSYPGGFTGFNSNLYPDHNEPTSPHYYHISCDESINNLIKLGVPANKILMGIPTYGYRYHQVPALNNGLYQPFSGHAEERIYASQIQTFLNSGFKQHEIFYHRKLSAVWAYNRKTKTFITYDNQALMQEKQRYIKANKLAGSSLWCINYS